MTAKNNKPTKLEKTRKAAGLSRSDLGYLSDVSDRTIEGLEQKRYDINKSAAINLLKLARALNVDPWDLMEDEEEQKNSPGISK